MNSIMCRQPIINSLLISFFVISASNNTTKLNALSAGNIYTNSAYTKEELNKGVIYTDELEVINEGINYYTDKIIFDNNENNYFKQIFLYFLIHN